MGANAASTQQESFYERKSAEINGYLVNQLVTLSHYPENEPQYSNHVIIYNIYIYIYMYLHIHTHTHGGLAANTQVARLSLDVIL